MKRVQASQVVMDIRPYRIGLLERIARRDDIELTMYAGLVDPGVGTPETPPEVPVLVRRVSNVFWPRNRLKVMWQRGALATLRDESSVIVLQEVVSNLTVWAIRLLHRRFGKSLVLQGHFYRADAMGPLERIRTGLRRFLRASASALVAYTEQGRNELLAAGGNPDAIFVNSNTLDTANLIELAADISENESASVRTELDIPANAIVLAFLGRLRSIKRVEVAIETLKELARDEEQPYVLLVIGHGEEKKRLIEQADGAPVVFWGQTYDEREIARLLSTCSLLFMPGSVGLACVHGFANSLPCLTTSADATTQTPEFAYVEHGYNGVIAESPDPHLFARLIVDMTSDESRLEELREGALQTARKLNMHRMVDSFVAAIRYAAQNPAKGKESTHTRGPSSWPQASG